MYAKQDPPPGLRLRYIIEDRESSDPKRQVHRLAWSPDGEVLAISLSDQSIQCFDIGQATITKVLVENRNNIDSLCWSPDGSYLAASDYSSTILVWNWQAESVEREIQGGSGIGNALAWSPDGNILAVGAQQPPINLVEISTGKRIGKIKSKYGSSALLWSSDGSMICSADTALGWCHNTISYWNTYSGDHVRTLSGNEHRRLSRSQEKNKLGGLLSEPTNFITSIVWSLDEKILISGSSDNRICAWDSTTGKLLKVIDSHTELVKHLSISFNGLLLASKSSDDTIRLWLMESWEQVAIFHENTTNSIIGDLAFHPKAPILATLGDDDMCLRIWEINYDALLTSRFSERSINEATKDIPTIIHWEERVSSLGQHGSFYPAAQNSKYSIYIGQVNGPLHIGDKYSGREHQET